MRARHVKVLDTEGDLKRRLHKPHLNRAAVPIHGRQSIGLYMYAITEREVLATCPCTCTSTIQLVPIVSSIGMGL